MADQLAQQPLAILHGNDDHASGSAFRRHIQNIADSIEKPVTAV
jgi:hypothetical protein